MLKFSLLLLIASAIIGIAVGDYINPVIPKVNTPDPGVIFHEGKWYATTTSNDEPNSFPIWKSDDLVNWHNVGYVFPKGHRPTWAVQDFWAPEIHKINHNTFNVYFAARDKTGLLCVGVASSVGDITGPYTDIGSPLVRTPGMGTIDPTSFVDVRNERYLVWKEDGNAIGKPTPINARRLHDNGLSFLPHTKVHVLISNTEAWEGAVTEGPWVLHYMATYWLFYSGNGYAGPKYAVGVAKSSSPTGPYTKYPNPILITGDEFIGPGHCSVVQVSSNDTYMIYHAWDNKMTMRNMMLDRVLWDGNEWPYLPGGIPTNTSQPNPPKSKEIYE